MRHFNSFVLRAMARVQRGRDVAMDVTDEAAVEQVFECHEQRCADMPAAAKADAE